MFAPHPCYLPRMNTHLCLQRFQLPLQMVVGAAPDAHFIPAICKLRIHNSKLLQASTHKLYKLMHAAMV